MDYTLILNALQAQLTQLQNDLPAAQTRSASLGAEYEKSKAQEVTLAKGIESTQASIRGIEKLIQDQATTADTTAGA